MINKIANKYKYIGFKFFIAFVVFAIFILSAILVVHLTFSTSAQNEKFKSQALAQSNEKLSFLNSFIQKRVDSVRAVSSNPYFQEYVLSKKYIFNTEFLFYTIMDENKEYMQLRFIDKNGKEKLRFDRKYYGQTPYKVEKLQDKHLRYYFHQTQKLKKDEIFISKIDFNKEYGKIQKPYIPVIRIATPVYNYNSFKGILIVNIFMKDFLNIFTTSAIYDIYLATNDGYIIKDINKLYDWTLKNKHLNDIYSKEISQKILDTKDENIIYSKKIFIKKVKIGFEPFLIIYSIKNSQIIKNDLNNKKMAIVILIFALVISIIFGYLMSRPPKKMFEIVVKQREELENLANTLEKRVEEETLKNSKKDKMLQHQAKLAELGDMIGNIAHQWRHPLTRLSLLLQNLKLYKTKDKMTNEIFFDTLDKVDSQILFMSNTIDNFKDFYRTDKSKKLFFVKDCLKDILNIIGTVLEHKNIELMIEDNNNEIYGIKNQFSQVLLNLIINAKDAFEDKNIQDKMIKIKSYQKNDKIRVEVIDNAGGIPDDFIDDIFESDFTTKDLKGTGIGLYLCKTIIEDEMKGKIYVTNDEFGAIFTIELKR